MTTDMKSTTTAATAADLVAPDDYELTVFLKIDLGRYPRPIGESISDYESVLGDFCIEAGRDDGAWRLRVLPWSGVLKDGDDDFITGPPVLDLSDQREGADPLALLRALLSGGSA